MDGPNEKMSDQERQAKRLKTDKSSIVEDIFGDEGLRSHIFSYASTRDLCTTDLVNQCWQTENKKHWERFARSRFALFNGKDSWRMGVALLRKPIEFNLCDDGDFGFGMSHFGSATMATNQNILVAVHDDDREDANDPEHADRKFPGPPHSVAVRDALSLNFARTMPGAICSWRPAICGEKGAEIIVTYNGTPRMVAQRGDYSQNLLPEGMDQESGGGDGAAFLGSESHLIVATMGSILVFEVVGKRNELLKHIGTHPLQSPASKSASNYRYYVSWCNSNDKTTFALCSSEGLSTWKFDSSNGDIQMIIEVLTPNFSYTNVTLTKSFVVVTADDRLLHVFCRESLEKVKTLSEFREDEDLHFDEIYPINAIAPGGGDLLVSTTLYRGPWLRVWNLQTGDLLKRHGDTRTLSSDEVECTDFVYLEHLETFVTMVWTMWAHGFPTSTRSKKMILSMHRRERNMERLNVGLGQGEMVGDDESFSYLP